MCVAGLCSYVCAKAVVCWVGMTISSVDAGELRGDAGMSVTRSAIIMWRM